MPFVSPRTVVCWCRCSEDGTLAYLGSSHIKNKSGSCVWLGQAHSPLPRRKTLATAEGTDVAAWDVQTGKELWRQKLFASLPWLLFSPDSKIVVHPS